MTKRRRAAHFYVLFAALGLAAAAPSTASAVTVTVANASTAPYSVNNVQSDVPVIYMDMQASGGSSNFSTFNLSMFGDAPLSQVSAKLWRDNGDSQFGGGDTQIGSGGFSPGGANMPPSALMSVSETLNPGPPVRYYVTVSFNGVPPARKLSFAFRQPSDFGVPGQTAAFPIVSSATIARLTVNANPVNGGFNYPFPVGGSTRSGGLDTGVFVRAGQRVHAETIPGDQWNVPALVSAAGSGPPGNLGGFNRGALVGRIGGGPWFLIGQTSTVTATAAGTLYVAAEDDDWSDNSGAIRAVFEVLPSTTPKRWLGGTLGFENAADIDQNWAGGRPYNGETAVFYASAWDCHWNLRDVTLAALDVSTAFTKSITVTVPPFVWGNRLSVTNDALIRGGRFQIGTSSITSQQGQVDLFVGGKLVVSDTATFVMGGTLGLGVGAEFRGAALLTSHGNAGFVRYSPDKAYYIRIDRATAAVEGMLQATGIDFIEFSSSPFVSIEKLDFPSFDTSTNPLVRFISGSTVAYEFSNWSSNPPARSPGVAAFVPAGSTITFLNSMSPSGNSFGSPNTTGNAAAVHWLPDGGGAQGQIQGLLSSLPGNTGTYNILASTSPKGAINNAVGGGVILSTSMAGVPRSYTLMNLRAPGTYYLFAYVDDGSNGIGAHSPRGGFNHPGEFRSAPVFVPAGANIPGVNITAKPWGAVNGVVSNQSSQFGPFVVETWGGGLPNVALSTRQARSAPTSGSYLFETPSDFGGILHSSAVFAFVDANLNGQWDAFEASGTVNPVNVAPGATTTVNVAITGGAPAPGGAVTMATAAVHLGVIGAGGGDQALIRVRMTASASTAALAGVRLRHLGTPVISPSGLGLWADDGDAAFGAGDVKLGGATVVFGGPSTATVQLSSAAVLQPGVPRDFFITLDLGSGGISLSTAGVMIEAATSFVLAAGTFSATPAFPVFTAGLPVYRLVSSSATADAGLNGGVDTGFFTFVGQQLNFISTGSIKTGPNDSITGPDGASGTTGLNTVLPAANRGELIGRVRNPISTTSSPWFRIGASTSVPAPLDGFLMLAVNDFIGAYSDNTGFALTTFTVSGSTLGAISGQVFYSTPVAGTGTVYARRFGSQVLGQQNFGIAASTAYPFHISGLPPGPYDLVVSHGSSTDFGLSNQQVQVSAAATATLNATMYLATGTIAGTISYSGVTNQGDFHIGVATVTDFTGEVHFFGGVSTPAAAAYSIGMLPAPATYYVVAYRDANNNDRPDGPEPLGYHGVPGSGLFTLASSMTAVYLPGAGTVPGINFSLNDLGSVEGAAVLASGATGALFVEVGRGVVGAPGYVLENRIRLPVPAAGAPPGGLPYSAGLLRPATNYSLFAFLDKNSDGQPSAGEEQATLPATIGVPSGGRANIFFSLVSLSSPAAPSVFVGSPTAVSTVAFVWNLVPGATGYQLRRAGGSVILSLPASASNYFDVLLDNTSSQIRAITASNGNGTSSSTTLAAPVYSRAAAPAAPIAFSVGSSSASLSWTTSNAAGTVYELQRATNTAVSGAIPVRVYSGTTPAFVDSLAPASTYFWSVRAINGNGLPTAYSADVAAITLPAAGPALSGRIVYTGQQAANTGRGFVVEASTSSATFFPRVSSAALAGGGSVPYYLPVGAGVFFVRAYVDVAGNGVLQAGADRGVAGSFAVSGSSVDATFSIAVDTVAPGAPAGLVAAPGQNKVTLTWVAPTKNANNSNLADLAGFVVERSTSLGSSFFALNAAALSSGTLTFVDNAPMPGAAGFYRVRALDLGGNLSAPSGAAAASASGGGSISGQIRSFSVHTGAAAGQFRVRLTTMPASSAPSFAEAGVTTYTFTGLPDGVYYVRAFRDLNGNGVEDPLNEPSGTFGGLNQPFPINVINANAVGGADATICDRSPLLPPGATGQLTVAGCPALDKGPGFTTSLFAFAVGGGAAGSLGVGSQINLSFSTGTAFASDLILLGPNGNVVGRDNRAGGASLTVTLNAPGVYIAEPTSFNTGVTGNFALKMRLEGGFAGVIAGSVTYSGARPGVVYSQLFNAPGEGALPILTSTNAAPGTYTFSGLPDGSYYVRSFRDANGNGVRDYGEPSGQFGVSVTTPTAIPVTGGLALGGPFVVPISDPAAGILKGAALYEGTASAPIRVEVGRQSCQGCSSFNDVISFTTVAAGGVYNFPFLPAATNYVLRAIVDVNGNGRQDALEAAISTFPVSVFVNATSTVSFIVRDGGNGFPGGAIVVGTVTYAGASTGPIVIGLSRDPGFRSVDYLLVLPTTGSFSRGGLAGDATYYLAGFIDTNLNNNPDEISGEASGIGSTAAYVGTIDPNNPPLIYVSPTGLTTVQLTLNDAPTASLLGTVRYAGSAPVSSNLIVQTFPAAMNYFEPPRDATIVRAAGVSTYAWSQDFLPAGMRHISAFIDSNGNGRSDPGEPFGSRSPVTLSSGAGSFPAYGVDLELLDPGSLGPALSAGRIRGDMVYLGTLSGPMYVRLFSNPEFLGSPVYTVRVPATGTPSPGSGEFLVDIPNLPFGEYWLDAFRDPTDSGVYNPASHARGLLNGGQSVELSQEQSSRYVFGGQITDPGQGGSVNRAFGDFASASGARFDGGATDMAAVIAVDSTTSYGPQPIVLGVTAQNEGVVVAAVRYSSAGVVLSSAVISTGDDLQIGQFALDPSGFVYMPERIETIGESISTAAITVYDQDWTVMNYAEFPGYQGFDGMSYAAGSLYAASRFTPTNEVRALRINPGSMITVATGTFNAPGGCSSCNSRVQGAAVSPDGSTFMVYAIVNQEGEDSRGLHFLLKFSAGMTLVASRDVTSLGIASRGSGVSMAVNNAGELYLAFTTDGDTARTHKFDVSGSAITPAGSTAYGPIKVHFNGGFGNLRFDPNGSDIFEVWESTTGAGDYLLLRYNPSLVLTRQRFFDGHDGTLEDTGFSLDVYDSSTVFVSGGVNNGQNLDWGVARLNGNSSGSGGAPGAPPAITTATAVNYIAGTVSYAGSLVSSGAFRITLTPLGSDVPIRLTTAPFGASRPFLFNNVPDGLYDVRAFLDASPNLALDTHEPSGASTLYGLEFFAETGSQDLSEPVQLCDRRPVAFGAPVLDSLSAADCTSPDRPGAPRRLYTFHGTRGQPVTIRLHALGFYDSYFDLYGPDGDWLDYDDDSGGDADAELVNYVLPEDGTYTIDAGAYAADSFGLFRLSLTGSEGAPGGITGRVDYAGSQGGDVIVGLFDSPAFSSVTTVARLVLTSTRSFEFEHLAAGTTYYLGAFIDVNANLVPDSGEDSGVFGSGAPNPILLAPGQVATGVEIAVLPSTASAASAAFVTGAATFAGAPGGQMILEFWSSSNFTGRPIASRVVPTGLGPYDTAVPGGVPYYVRAYLDRNGDYALQPNEPRGVYAPNGQGAEPLFAPVGQTLVNVDIVLKDPGVAANGVFIGEGTATLSVSSLTAGGLGSLTIVYTAGANGVAGTGSGTPGQIGFTVPPGFPFPVNSVLGSSVTATSTASALTLAYNGPSAIATVAGAGGLVVGQTVVLQFTNFYVPCSVGAATFTVSQTQKNTASPAPLILGSPSLAVAAGAPSYASLDEPYFSVKADELSEARRVVTYDNCGLRAPTTAQATVDLRPRFFNGSAFVTDPTVGVTTSPAQSTGTSVTLDFAVGQSSRVFYVLAASTGFKNLEAYSTIGFGSTYYFGVNAVPANALTNVTVSTVAFGGVALSSASIGLAASGQPNLIFVNFSLGDPNQPWHVLVSSLPFKAGERPTPVWERWGHGQPNKGEIAWDGRYSPWIQGGARVPNGLYYGRVELGYGGVKDDALRLTVALPQFAGRAFDPGTVPNPPLSSLQLRVYGPSGYFTAATGADGSYVLPGLGAGNYRLNVSRPDYVDGQIDVTLNGSGAATSFIPRTLGVLVSSNATGGLDLFVSRAPRLVVVPALDPSVATSAVVQWGSLQIRPSTSVAGSQSTFYGPMRLNAGTTTFDDGGQWDQATQQFVTRTLLGFNVPVGTYTVLADLAGYSRSSASVYVGADGARADLPAFLPKGVITGQVNLASPAGANGLSVGITATAIGTNTATTGLSGGAFVNGGSTYAVYSLSGFDPGAYLLRANTQGLSSSTTGPIVVSGTSAVTGVNFPNFGAGATINGTITAVGAANGTQIYVNAWSPGSFNFGSTVVYTAGGAAAYSMPGLDAGATYQLYANISAQEDYDLTVPAGGFPLKVVAPATQNFTLTPASGVVSGTILLRAGSTDFTNVTLHGLTIASLKPSEVGRAFVDVSTSLPNFLCGDGSSGATGYCPPGVSSATFRVQGVNTATLDIRFLHSATGQTSRQTVSVVNGSTFTLVADLRGSTFSISGQLVNNVADALFNTNAKVVANAPFVAPLGYPPGISSTSARVVAIKQDIDQFGVAISTVFDRVSTRVGFLDASGAFTIPDCPNGNYLVRTADLRSCATCPIIVPAVGRAVSVSGASVSSVTLTISNGYSITGAITLDGGLQDSQIFDLSIFNRRQELVRSTQVYLGDPTLGTVAGTVDYAFTNLPAGEFYTLVARGAQSPAAYAARPVKFPDPALSPAGLQSNLSAQNVLMQRAAYATGRLKDGGTGEQIGAANAALLAPNFAITATANPWTEGGFVQAASSVSARPILADGTFRVGPLLPGVSYDLRFAQTTWDPNFLANGSQNFTPVVIGGVKLTAGEVRDLGAVTLGQGLSVTGSVKSTTTGLGLGNIKVVAKPSYGDDLVVQTFTNQQGLYTLWVSTLVSNQFTLTAAPRDGNQASDGKYYGQVTLNNVNLITQTSAHFLLTPLSVVVTGQVVVADAGSGGVLSYPFGDKRGFPAAAVNLQPAGVVPANPLGDIEATTDERGFFSVPGLSTGLYVLHATSLGYSVYNATVSVQGSAFRVFVGSDTPANDLAGNVITLARGATVTGRILKSDGTSPNSTEVVGVAAANFGSGEFVVGSVEVDAVAKTVGAYTISGFKTGVPYNIVLLSGSKGKEVSFPPEGAGVLFTASESTTTKTVNLTYRPAALDCLGTAKALDASRTQFAVQIDCLKPLRQETSLDDDLTQILTLSTFTAANTALAAPNGAGALSQRLLSSDRRTLTAIYTLAVAESRFTMRVRASAAEINPATGDNFAIDKVFDFYAGLDAHADGRVTNIDGGAVSMRPSAQDELLGLDERSRIDLPPGAFGEGSDSLADSSVVAQPTTTVNVSMSKGRDQALARALSVATLGYAPAALEVPDTPSAFPSEMWAAMSQYRTQASTVQVGGANPLSAFYSIFLPAGIRHQLKKNADLTLSYSLAASTSTNENNVQVWFYNAVLGRFVLENTNRRVDTVNKTITVSVNHFSTFVVLDSTPTATADVTFGGEDIAVANFPNPADCIVHSNIARNATLFGAGGVHAPFVGTMIRTSIPGADSAPLKINIYTVAGEKIRTIEQGDLPGAKTYYTPWDCRNDNGQTIASGVYIGEAVHGGKRRFFKIAIIKGSGL